MATITASTGNVAGATTTLTVSNTVNLTLVSDHTVTRGGIVCSNVTVIDASTLTFSEPVDGLELGVNSDIILGHA